MSIDELIAFLKEKKVKFELRYGTVLRSVKYGLCPICAAHKEKFGVSVGNDHALVEGRKLGMNDISILIIARSSDYDKQKFKGNFFGTTSLYLEAREKLLTLLK